MNGDDSEVWHIDELQRTEHELADAESLKSDLLDKIELDCDPMKLLDQIVRIETDTNSAVAGIALAGGLRRIVEGEQALEAERDRMKALESMVAAIETRLGESTNPEQSGPIQDQVSTLREATEFLNTLVEAKGRLIMAPTIRRWTSMTRQRVRWTRRRSRLVRFTLFLSALAISLVIGIATNRAWGAATGFALIGIALAEELIGTAVDRVEQTANRDMLRDLVSETVEFRTEVLQEWKTTLESMDKGTIVGFHTTFVQSAPT